jgi:pseudaminic acid synthase
MKIENYTIGVDHSPFVIAEMSGNHNQSLSRALQIVDAVANSGAHAIKLQTYKPETITIKSSGEEFTINDKNSIWNKKELFSLFEKACTPYEWHKPIFERAREKGLICFSSPFDEDAVDFLEELNVPAYKIASFENNHYPLIEKVASTGKPVIISTGMASLDELKEVAQIFKHSKSKDLVFLKCTSTYPASADNTNIITIPELKKIFQCEIGISDHTLGIGTSVAAVALGATVIEKHFTIDRLDGGVDSSFSMEPSEFKMLVKESHNAWLSLGQVFIGPTENEIESVKFRRSIYAIKDIEKGELFSEDNIAVIRPGNGIHPRYFKGMIGKKSIKKIKYGTPILDIY